MKKIVNHLRVATLMYSTTTLSILFSNSLWSFLKLILIEHFGTMSQLTTHFNLCAVHIYLLKSYLIHISSLCCLIEVLRSLDSVLLRHLNAIL